MKKYKFCIKGSKEAIASIDAASQEDATVLFAKMKNLSIEKFISLYDTIPA